MTLYLGWIIGIPLVLLSFNIFLLIIKKKYTTIKFCIGKRWVDIVKK